MTWVNCVGVGLQVFGLVWAMYLPLRLREVITQTEVLPLRQLRTVRTEVDRLWRRLRRRPPATHEVTLTATQSQWAALALRIPRPTMGSRPVDASLEEQLVWLEGCVRDVEQRHNQLLDDVGVIIGTVESKVREHTEVQIREAATELRAELGALQVRDVYSEVASLALIAVGVVLAVVGQ